MKKKLTKVFLLMSFFTASLISLNAEENKSNIVCQGQWDRDCIIYNDRSFCIRSLELFTYCDQN
jgi:hypothetical protein